MTGYPIELKLEGRTVVVVGLGAVGRRKAVALRGGRCPGDRGRPGGRRP